MKTVPDGYWTYERCKEEALKFETRKELMKNNSTVYGKIKKNKWHELFYNMINKKRKNGYWNYEECKNEALKYNRRVDFQNSKISSSAYLVSLKNGWLEEFCKHMKIKIPYSYWTYENCKNEALKYKTRTEFKTYSNSAWDISRKNNWADDVCSHMEYHGDKMHRCIYACEFPDNSVYIGLTFNIKKRKISHLCSYRSTVYKYIKENNITPNIIKLTDYIDVKEAINKEEYFVNFYKEKNWKILNKVKTGGLGNIR